MIRRKFYQCLSVLIFILSVNQPVSALAYEYNFNSGGTTGYGKSSDIDMDYVIYDNSVENIRRDKEITYEPPGYGTFSGEIPTDLSSFYYISNNETEVNTVTVLPELSQLFLSASNANTVQILPKEYKDGSIGTLSIPKIKLTTKIYEGETNENMRKGAGHFTNTSAWDGNVAFAGHNRGFSAYFAGIKDLINGDKITYTTAYGVRTYQVFLKEKISDTDTSYLNWSDENILTMITCIANEPSYRLCVQAREIQ